MYGDSQAPSPGSVPIFASIFQPKQEPAAVFPKTREQHQLLLMESDANTNYSERRQQFSGANSCQGNSGLLSDVSAPTSVLENAAEKTERFHSRFLSDEPNRMHVLEGDGSRFASMKSQLPPQYPRQSGGGQLGSLAVDGGGYGVGSSVGLNHLGHGRMGSGLMSQDKSPPGLFSHLTSQNGYAGARGIGGFRSMASGGANGRLSPSSIWLENHMNFASGKPSSLEMLSRNENGAGLGDIKVGNGGSSDNSFINSGFPFGSWNDSSRLAENFTGHVIKREMDIDQKLFANIQHGEPGNRPFALSPHLSLPKTSAQMVAMEKLLQLQDAVPCKIRAKRGCATHPRSIAERVRRSRISDRMRKLQDLVPNMDKQTNTADMLDLAIEYIKSLQKQYKTLSASRANCKCSASQRAALDQTH